MADLERLPHLNDPQPSPKCFGGNSMNLSPFKRCAASVRPRALLSACVLLYGLSAGCQGLGGYRGGPLVVSRTPATPAELGDVFKIERSIRVQETSQALLVLPVVTTDSLGRFLVADILQHQVRRYDPDGKLLHVFGAKGEGPGEFTNLAGAVEVRDGLIIAIDRDGEVIYFDATGKELDRPRSSLQAIHNISVVDDTTVAITGRTAGDLAGPLVHLWNVPQKRIVRSFFTTPPHKPSLSGAYRFSDNVDVAIRGDTAAVTIALSDTVYLFTIADGQMRTKIPLAAPHFRHVQSSPPANMAQSDTARRAWSRTFSRISRVFWAPDGSLYVQFFDLKNAAPQWNLVHIRRDGGPSWEVHNNPRLLTVSAYDSRLYFVHPQSEADTLWAIGRRSVVS
jgi:hypothetical protein